MIKNSQMKTKNQNGYSLFSPLKHQALCKNKEFFYSKAKIQRIKNISEEEYKEALKEIEIMDTIYFEMTKDEKKSYNIYINIIKNYLSQTK